MQLSDELTETQLLDFLARGRREFLPRWNLIKRWRDLRYGRDNVKGLIPDASRVTDFEYHDDTFNKACFELASYLAAADPVITVPPPSNGLREEAEDIASVLTQILGPGGILDRESGYKVPFKVWQNQGENGHGIYKLVLKRSYPLSMPQRLYSESDDSPDATTKFELNAKFEPHTRKDTREQRGATKFRETDASLKGRRDQFEADEFPWQWMDVDPRTYFEFRQGGVPVIQGELTQRPATVLGESGLPELMRKDAGYVFLGQPTPENASTPGNGSQYMVHCAEMWAGNRGYMAFVSATQGTDGAHRFTMSKSDDWTWDNPLQRLPYFPAFGLVSTEEDTAGELHGIFDSLIIETPLLNYLETMHFNAGHKQQNPIYQPVRDPSFGGEAVPLNAEQQTMVTEEQIDEVDLPPGWKWEPVNPGTEVSIFQQLQACRERIDNNALAAVLTGKAAAGDSGAKVSLQLNAAGRALSPLVRNHGNPMADMGHTILETSKRLRITLAVERIVDDGTGTSMVEKHVLKPADIITTRVDCTYNIELPVDQAALESRGMALMASGRMSYETAAPRYLRVKDPDKEKNRIRLDKYDAPMDEIAFRMASQDLAAYAPEIFADIMKDIVPPAPPEKTVGGGPGGAYGGASADAARGASALPGAVQMDGQAPTTPTAAAAPQRGGFRMSDGR